MITINGKWDANQQSAVQDIFDQMQAQPRQAVLMVGCRRLFWIDWWAERYRFEALPMSLDESGDGAFEMTMRPEGVLVIERSAWWRRWGYAVVSLLPSWRIDCSN